MSVNYTEDEIKHAHEVLFNEGLKMRYQVAGKEYVDASLKNGKGPFAGAMQEVSPRRPNAPYGCLVSHRSGRGAEC